MREPTKSEISAFVGRETGYYLKTWFPEDLMIQPVSGEFNTAAFWGSLLWLGYRKMYDKGIFFMLAYVLTQLAMVFLLALVSIISPGFLETGAMDIVVVIVIPIIALLALAFFCGTYGNLLYQAHVYNSIAEERQANSATTDVISALSKRGGTNWLAAIVCVLWLVGTQLLLKQVFLSLISWVSLNMTS